MFIRSRIKNLKSNKSVRYSVLTVTIILGEKDRKYYQEWTDGVFKLDTFIDDLAQLYSVFTYVYAFLECLNGNPESALNYYKSGHYFHTVPWFADYMARIDVEKYDIDPNWDDITRAINDSEHSKMHLNTKEEFRKAIVTDKVNIYKKMENMIPEIKLSLSYDDERKKCELVANVESIFDICYYSIARLLAVNAPSEDPNTEKYSVYDLGDSISFCEVCGRMYVKSGNNQKCCGDEACIRTNNRKRQARHRQKIKENKQIKSLLILREQHICNEIHLKRKTFLVFLKNNMIYLY